MRSFACVESCVISKRARNNRPRSISKNSSNTNAIGVPFYCKIDHETFAAAVLGPETVEKALAQADESPISRQAKAAFGFVERLAASPGQLAWPT
jgi:hypothetical protein